MGTHVREPDSHVREYVMVEQHRLRKRTEAAIESLLALLDQLEADPDLEPENDDEPSLGWREGRAGASNCPTLLDEGEDDDPAEDEHDCEYTAIERHGRSFFYSGPDDAEESYDVESDPGEWGIGDEDGALEQYAGAQIGATVL